MNLVYNLLVYHHLSFSLLKIKHRPRSSSKKASEVCFVCLVIFNNAYKDIPI